MDESSIITESVFDAYVAAETLLKLREGTASNYKNGIPTSTQLCDGIVEKSDCQRNFLKHTSTSTSKLGDIQQINDSSPNLTCAKGDVIRKCKVCGDKAKRKHYGTVACEGCKSFFRRSILQRAIFMCPSGFMCRINKASKNRCGACRYRKCIDSGMIPKAVGAIVNRRIREIKLRRYFFVGGEISPFSVSV